MLIISKRIRNSCFFLPPFSNQKYIYAEQEKNWRNHRVVYLMRFPFLPLVSLGWQYSSYFQQLAYYLRCSVPNVQVQGYQGRQSKPPTFTFCLVFCAVDLSWIPIPVYFKRVAVSFLPRQMPLRCQWTVSWCSPSSSAVAFPLFKRWVWILMFF